MQLKYEIEGVTEAGPDLYVVRLRFASGGFAKIQTDRIGADALCDADALSVGEAPQPKERKSKK